MLIGITGRMGTGKTTATNALMELYDFENLRFSKPLYDIQNYIYESLGLTLEGAKDRELLQYIGTDWGRKRDPDIWINRFKTLYNDNL